MIVGRSGCHPRASRLLDTVLSTSLVRKIQGSIGWQAAEPEGEHDETGDRIPVSQSLRRPRHPVAEIVPDGQPHLCVLVITIGYGVAARVSGLTIRKRFIVDLKRIFETLLKQGPAPKRVGSTCLGTATPSCSGADH
jgi:hypothetical protein